MKLIVGLGNPGGRYANNRHNVGFMIVEKFAERRGIEFSVRKKKAVFGRGICNGEEVVLLKPQTFMNLSGEAVLYLASFLKIKTVDIIAVADDTELDFGKIRIRRRGGSGGNNGIKSLINSLKSENFPRLRFGIGTPRADSGKDLCSYVLEDFTPQERETLDREIEKAVEALYVMVTDTIERAMNIFNNK